MSRRLAKKLRSGFRLLVSDRLFWFVLLGCGLFALDYALSRADERLIMVDKPALQRLAAQWQAQYKRPPTRQELGGMVQHHVRESILAREAARLQLDQNDVIVQRRLAQKMQYVLAGRSNITTPNEQVLREFFSQNKNRYSQPARVSFRHVFLGAGADANSGSHDATTVLQQLKDGAAWRDLGLPFMLQREYGEYRLQDVAQNFGEGFAKHLQAFAQQREWHGPVESAYGLHLVQIVSFSLPKTVDFDAVAERVANDWVQQQLQAAEHAEWMKLRTQYRVELAPLEP